MYNPPVDENLRDFTRQAGWYEGHRSDLQTGANYYQQVALRFVPAVVKY